MKETKTWCIDFLIFDVFYPYNISVYKYKYVLSCANSATCVMCRNAKRHFTKKEKPEKAEKKEEEDDSKKWCGFFLSTQRVAGISWNADQKWGWLCFLDTTGGCPRVRDGYGLQFPGLLSAVSLLKQSFLLSTPTLEVDNELLLI